MLFWNLLSLKYKIYNDFKIALKIIVKKIIKVCEKKYHIKCLN